MKTLLYIAIFAVLCISFAHCLYVFNDRCISVCKAKATAVEQSRCTRRCVLTAKSKTTSYKTEEAVKGLYTVPFNSNETPRHGKHFKHKSSSDIIKIHDTFSDEEFIRKMTLSDLQIVSTLFKKPTKKIQKKKKNTSNNQNVIYTPPYQSQNKVRFIPTSDKKWDDNWSHRMGVNDLADYAAYSVQSN
jgi:hypothetical protein